jgi:hypothetical protein
MRAALAVLVILLLAAPAQAGGRHGCWSGHRALYGWPYADAKDREIRALCHRYRCVWNY